ncbi:MAG: CheR family methyltransferase [Candidatus Heimdallarchaeota archaeon]
MDSHSDEDVSGWIEESKRRRKQLSNIRKATAAPPIFNVDELSPQPAQDEDVSNWIGESKSRRKKLSKTRGSSEAALSLQSEGNQEGLQESDGIAEWMAQSKNRRRDLSKKRSQILTRRQKKSTREDTHQFSSLRAQIPDSHVLPMLAEQLLLMGFDISSYEEKYLKRRLEILLRKSKLKTYDELLTRVLLHPDEALEYVKRTFSINVTRFFRNFDAWWALQRTVFPQLFSREFTDGPVRIWSAGCAMGPEPYTLAILAHNFKARHPGETRDVTILATDLNPALLEVAAVGEYSSSTLEETPPVFQSQYFEAGEDDLFRVNSEIRKVVQFQQHDLFSSIPSGKRELITCRNVMIYFNRTQKEKMARSFAKSLVRGGFLFLGGSETLPIDLHEIFEPVNLQYRIYQRV